MFRYLKLYPAFVNRNLKAVMEYKLDYIIGAISEFVIQLCNIITVWIILNNIKTINGWGFYEIAFVFGLISIAIGIDKIFFDTFWNMFWHIRDGYFDVFLIRPISPLFHLIGNRFEPGSIGELIIGLIISIKAAITLKIAFNFINIFLFTTFAVSGGLILSGTTLLINSLNFWLLGENSLAETVYSLHQFAKYPMTIFPKFILLFLTWCIPYAFVSFYPANYFFKKGFESLSVFSPSVAIIVWVIAVNVWSIGINRYESTGS